MKHKIFVDGQEGTTGLEIYQRLEKRPDLELLRIDPDKRKDPAERKRLANEADIVFLCLPDDAAREQCRLLITIPPALSTRAPRTVPIPTGFTEYPNSRRTSGNAYRTAGAFPCPVARDRLRSPCYPLIAGGMIPADYPFSFQSLTGYSGGGKTHCLL